MKIPAKTKLLLLSTLVVMSCGNKETSSGNLGDSSQQPDVTLTSTQFEQEHMQLGSLQETTFSQWVEASGMIDVPPENRAIITAFKGGYVKDNPLLIGDAVQKGQVLITLENPEFVNMQQEFKELDVQLAYLKSEYERQQALLDEQITSKKSFLKAESTYKTSLAHHQGLKKQLQMLNISTSQALQGNFTSLARIYAPITGTIAETFVSKGSYVSPADPLMEIIDIDHIHLELSVFEKDMLRLKKEQAIWFKIPESSEQEYPGTVYLIGHALNPKTRTVKVHGHINNEKDTPNFAVGMFIEAQIETGKVVGTALPETAVVNLGEQFYVLQLQEKREGAFYFKRLEVQPGKTQNGSTEILNAAALDSTKQFLTRGAFELIRE